MKKYLLTSFLLFALFAGINQLQSQTLVIPGGTLNIGVILTGEESPDGVHSFTVTGSGFNANEPIYADSPSAPFTLSLTGGSGTYLSSVIFSADGSGNVNQTIYVKYAPVIGGPVTIQVQVYEFQTFTFYYKSVTGIGKAPEMLLEGRETGADPWEEVLDGSTTPTLSNGTDFGSALFNIESVDRTFQITNNLPLGGLNGNLVLTEYDIAKYVEITGTHADQFSVTAEPGTPITTPFGTTTFTVRFEPTSYGVKTATISIANNDPDEDPYNFTIKGKGIVEAPGAPTANAATQIDNNSFYANWTVGGGGITDGYLLDVATDNLFIDFVPGFEAKYVGNVTTRIVTGLDASTMYYYRVRAINIGDTSDYSNIISLTTAPQVPTALAPSNVDIDAFYANWSFVTGATSYRLDVNTSPDFAGTAIYSDYTVTNTYLYITGLTSATTYYYRVRSFNGNASENSAIIAVVTRPGTPVATPATNIDFDGFTANWNPPTGGTPDFYKLDVSTTNLFTTYVLGYENLTVNGTSKVVTGLSENTTYYYRVRAVNVSGVSNNSNIIMVTTYTSNLTSTWTGATSTVWNDAGNWDNGIPSSMTDVTIPNVTNQPVVGLSSVCNDITMDPLTQLTVNNGVILTINGDLMLLASASGEASIVEYGGVNVLGNTSVEQYIEGSRWNFVSYPLDMPNTSVYEGLFLRYWVEATSDWQYIIDPDSALTVGQGYSTYTTTAAGDVTITYDAGDLNTGAINLPVEYSGSSDGWNVVGNPYPSAVDWDDASWVKTNIDAAIYVWDGTQYLVWNGLFGDLTDGVIPAYQSFYTKASAASPVLQVNNASRVHGPSPYKSSEVSNLIDVRVVGNGYDDITYINFNEGATAVYDSQFDAIKMFGIEEAPQLYSITENEILSINTLPEYYPGMVIPLGLKVGADAEYSIKVSNLSSFEFPVNVFIEDLLTGEMVNISSEEFYTFNASTEDNAERFLLHFMAVTDVNETSLSPVEIYSYDNSVYVKNIETENATISVVNIAGQIVYSGDLENTPLNRIDLNLETGYYVVKVLTSENLSTEKVFLK
ncbi:MAG: fibronectin type III domain-containing protein [Bacteroidetes bacterium]|nr:fibronectin type III domain-containing protein [Bacteroidota bacterium]